MYDIKLLSKMLTLNSIHNESVCLFSESMNLLSMESETENLTYRQQKKQKFEFSQHQNHYILEIITTCTQNSVIKNNVD